VLVLSLPDGVATDARGFFQVMRHRVMRGPALVQDEGWRPANQGVPAVEISDRYLIATGIEPVIRTDVPGFEQLHTKNIIVDMQSAVFDEAGEVLGGVDWQVSYRVTSRGDVSWQIDGGRPAFNAACDQARQVLDAARG
jgi:stage V sporulation protein SpoVS